MRMRTRSHEPIGGFAASLALELLRRRALRRRARRAPACTAGIDAAFDDDPAARVVATCTAERRRGR